jgi:glucose/arabinose dehydrogenase
MKVSRLLSAGLLAPILCACGGSAQLPPNASVGPSPELPAPNETLIPTINIAPAKSWSDGGMPVAADGLAAKPFAQQLNHPRWLHVLPNGDVLVAETNAPDRPEEGKGIRGVVQQWFMERAGDTVPSANRITLLRDADGDGVAETRHVFVQNLNAPFGMALVGDTLYVANTDAVVSFRYRPGETEIGGAGVKLTDLPGGPLNHHWTKGLLASADGRHLYASIGSNSNVGENGIEKEEGRALIVEIDRTSGRQRTVATGLRNPVGMALEPSSGALWTVVNERDELGSDLVPDYLTTVKEGAFYGWPYSYYGGHVDDRIKPQRPELVARAIAPDYALGNHVAPLGLTFAKGGRLGERYREGAFIGEHGSWNREPRNGYKVVFVPFANGKPSGTPEDVLTGFVGADGNAHGRPVGVAIDRGGALLVADDVGNTIWRVTAAPSRNMARAQ